METLILSQRDVQQLLTMPDAIEAVEAAYIAYCSGKVNQPPIVSIDVPEHRGELDIKACYSRTNEMISVKTAVGYWDNPQNFELPTLLATLTLFDGRSGYPLCIMDGGRITGYRTGAAGGVSAKWLARKDSKTVAVIGAGTQARMQVRAIKTVLPIDTVKVWSPIKEEMERYCTDLEQELGIQVASCENPEDAVRDADIVVTATPGKAAIVQDEWIRNGTHIIAIGADMEGKQELDPRIFARARVFVDSIEQCMVRGETQNPLKAGIMTAESICGELGDVLLGKVIGRGNDDEITLFDSTGMGVQDNTTAKMIYDRAREQGVGQSLILI